MMAPGTKRAHQNKVQEEGQQGQKEAHQETEEMRYHPPGRYQRWGEGRRDASHQT
jgi:hypothetical protein